MVDIEMLRTTRLEIGSWVGADQLTGRTAVVANAAVCNDPLYLYDRVSLYLG